MASIVALISADFSPKGFNIFSKTGPLISETSPLANFSNLDLVNFSTSGARILVIFCAPCTNRFDCDNTGVRLLYKAPAAGTAPAPSITVPNAVASLAVGDQSGTSASNA